MSQRCKKENIERHEDINDEIIPPSAETVAFALLYNPSVSHFNIYRSGFRAGQSDLDFSLTQSGAELWEVGGVKIHHFSEPVTRPMPLPETTTQVFSPLPDKQGAWKVSILLWAIHRHLFIFQGRLIDQSIGTVFQLQG